MSRDWVWVLVILIVALGLIWTYAFEPFWNWLLEKDILSTMLDLFLLGLICLATFLFFGHLYEKKRRKERGKREEMLRKRGEEELNKEKVELSLEVAKRHVEERAAEELRLEKELNKEKAELSLEVAKRHVEERAAEELRLEKKLAFEKEQRAKGLEKFINRFGGEMWGTPKQIAKWKSADNIAIYKQSLLYRLVQSIKEFQPSREYSQELGYHSELTGWLKHEFPNLRVEEQTGASRPDIVVEDIAIEVKGPTDDAALNTVATKCLKYSQHYKNIVFVLFQPIFSERNFREIEIGVDNVHPNVIIIRRDGKKVQEYQSLKSDS